MNISKSFGSDCLVSYLLLNEIRIVISLNVCTSWKRYRRIILMDMVHVRPGENCRRWKGFLGDSSRFLRNLDLEFVGMHIP